MFNVRPSLLVAFILVGCGNTFDASGAGGASGMDGAGADSIAGGTSSAGAGTVGGGTSSAGSANAGAAGEPDVGGGTSSGGSTGGGSGGAAAGTGGATDCEALKQDYQIALDKARVCTKGSLNQCSDSSTLPSLGCGCAVPVNSKSEYTTQARNKYKAIQDAHCDLGAMCLVACPAPSAVSCAPQSVGMANVFVCTAAN